MVDTPKNNPLAKFASSVKQEGSKVSVSFKEGTTQNKLAVLGGVSTGITFTLQGLKNARTGWAKDEKTGKRDLATAALGAAEIGGGLFLTGLFYHNLRLGNDIAPSFAKIRDKLAGMGHDHGGGQSR